MGILGTAARLSCRVGMARAAPVTQQLVRPVVMPAAGRRSIMTLSAPRRGHNLEDHFDMAEFVCKMHHPLGDYFFYFTLLCMVVSVAGPLVHSNYYFTGRFLPK